MIITNIFKTFYFVAWVISAVVFIYFAVKNRKENEKFILHIWIALAFMFIFSFGFKMWGGM